MKNRLAAMIAVALLALPMAEACAEDHTQRPSGAVVGFGKATICQKGYSRTMRPPTSYTDPIKKRWTPAGHRPQEYELDHMLPIGIGGHPWDTDNLWLQPWEQARRKDVLEGQLYRALCVYGTISVEQAQQRMREWK